MKKYVLFILFPILAIAQNVSPFESNFYVYNKFNCGYDINNIGAEMHINKKGELTCCTYSGMLFKIENTVVNPFLENKKNTALLISFFEFKNNIQYYCTSQEIIIIKNKKILRTYKTNGVNERSDKYCLFNKKIFFHTINDSNKKEYVKCFDGNRIITVSEIKKESGFYADIIASSNLYITTHNYKQFFISKLVNKKIIFLKKYTFPTLVSGFLDFKDENNFNCFNASDNTFIKIKNGIVSIQKTNQDIEIGAFKNYYFSNNVANEKGIWQYPNPNKLVTSTVTGTLSAITFNKPSNSYYCGNNNNLLRFFPHIKKYPRLFYNSNSNEVFSLKQDYLGKIWAGSYQGVLSTIDSNTVVQSTFKDIKFMNGGSVYKNKMILLAEANKGIYLFDDIKKFRKIEDSVICFYSFISKNNVLYVGTANKGLWFTPTSNLDIPKKINWSKISYNQGLELENITTICEDKYGTIWTGRGSQGIAIFNPKTKKAKTWLIDKKQISFSTMASTLDTHNTLWFGTNKGGLVFYNGKNETDYNVKNFITLKHPLLENGKIITFIHQWQDYLILGDSDKIILFDLKNWYANKNVVVRYLNSMEINLTSTTEQNTILTDKRDQSIWFATSDMVYQWDIKKWLTMPTFKVIPKIIIKKGITETEFSPNNRIYLEPTENSFDIQISYQTKDNMPRFINGILVKKGEKPVFESPNLQTKFQFKNLSDGDYVFYARICQQDGSYDVNEYPICIDSFLWQKWWLWFLLSIPFFITIIYFFQKRNEIEKQKKKLSQLNLSSLSNQFRPHFMLNALNSIGSQMHGKPHAEKVISRLGESINILYGFTQKNDFTLSFENEWKLVENSIEIQRLLFIPNLNFELKSKKLIPADYKIPVGLLQIPVENALLHGLRNKTDENCVLEIDFTEDETHYFITINDNGVGREKANIINNFKKNGNGLKTIFEMITIINQHQKKAVIFEIIDKIEPLGTTIKIRLNKNIEYDKIKI